MNNNTWLWVTVITLTVTVTFLQYRVNKIEKKVGV